MGSSVQKKEVDIMIWDIQESIDAALFRFDDAIAPEVLCSGNGRLMLRNLMESHFWNRYYGTRGIRPARRFKQGSDWADLVLINESEDGEIVCGVEIRWQMKYDLKTPAIGTGMTNTEHWISTDTEKLDTLEESHPKMAKYFVLFNLDFPPGELRKNVVYLNKNPYARKFPRIDLVDEWKKCAGLNFEEEVRRIAENEAWDMRFSTEPKILTMRHVPVNLRLDYCVMQLDRG